MNGREANKKRRLAYTQGLLPDTYASECTKPDGRVLTAHEVELSALGRIKQNEHSEWYALCAKTLSGPHYYLYFCSVPKSECLPVLR